MTSPKNNHVSIAEGTLLIDENTLLPEPMRHDSQSIGNGWARIMNNLAFEKKLAAAGWMFFYMAGTIRANALGFERSRMIRTAVKRLLATVALENCNCLAIDHIMMRSFCGIPFVTVLAHSRHIQLARSICTAGVLPG